MIQDQVLWLSMEHGLGKDPPNHTSNVNKPCLLEQNSIQNRNEKKKVVGAFTPLFDKDGIGKSGSWNCTPTPVVSVVFGGKLLFHINICSFLFHKVSSQWLMHSWVYIFCLDFTHSSTTFSAAYLHHLILPYQKAPLFCLISYCHQTWIRCSVFEAMRVSNTPET